MSAANFASSDNNPKISTTELSAKEQNQQRTEKNSFPQNSFGNKERRVVFVGKDLQAVKHLLHYI